MDFKIALPTEITAWDGMTFMKKLIEKSGIAEKLDELELPNQGSNRGYAPLQLIESFWLSVWCGANRLRIWMYCAWMPHYKHYLDGREWRS